MTTQEAISELESLPESNNSEAVLLAIQALKKQIPTRVLRKRWEISKCPCCNTELGEWLEDGYHQDYENLVVCNCGQQLDWSYPADDDD